MWTPAGTAGRFTGQRPTAANALNRPSTTVEHVGDNAAGLALQSVGRGLLRLQRGPQLRGHRKLPTVTVLGGAGLKANDPSLQVDLVPLHGEHFAVDAPARDVGERHRPAEILGQMPPHALELVPLEESLANVVLSQHRDRGLTVEPFALDRERVHALQSAQFPVHGGVCRAFLETGS